MILKSRYELQILLCIKTNIVNSFILAFSQQNLGHWCKTSSTVNRNVNPNKIARSIVCTNPSNSPSVDCTSKQLSQIQLCRQHINKAFSNRYTRNYKLKIHYIQSWQKDEKKRSMKYHVTSDQCYEHQT